MRTKLVRITLTEDRWLDLLLSLPENGMGYQLVDVTLKNGKIIRKAKVLNCEILELEQPLFARITESDIADIQPASKY